MGRKGQVAMEFMTLVALAFLTLVMLVAASGKQAIDVKEQKDIIQLKDVVYKNQEEILLASQSNTGYHREYYNPGDLSGTDYNLTIIKTELIGRTSLDEFSVVIPEISGNPVTGTNQITNLNGTVCLNC